MGIQSIDDAPAVLIRGGEFLSDDSFVADGEEVQLNDKRYGIKVKYNRDISSFEIMSGTTGETIAANGALGVTSPQKASNIQVGRYALDPTTGEIANATEYFAGDNELMGVGATKTMPYLMEVQDWRLAKQLQLGRLRTSLSRSFRLTNSNGENVFNVSVNGINGVITVPTGFYVGSTLASDKN